MSDYEDNGDYDDYQYNDPNYDPCDPFDNDQYFHDNDSDDDHHQPWDDIDDGCYSDPPSYDEGKGSALCIYVW